VGEWQTGVEEDKGLPARQLAGIGKRNGLILKQLGGVPGRRKKLPSRAADGALGKGLLTQQKLVTSKWQTAELR